MKLNTLKPNSYTQVYQYETVHHSFLWLTGKKKEEKILESTSLPRMAGSLNFLLGKTAPLDHMKVSFHTRDTNKTVLF